MFSLAAFEIKSDQPRVFHEGEIIEGLAKVLRIRRGKVFLRELKTRRLLYHDIPINEIIPRAEFAVVAKGISSLSPKDFVIDRAQLDRYTSDLGAILQQARAVPELDSHGQMHGFRMAMMQPGSLFEKIGLRQGDVITSVNGDRLNSAQKGIELYNQFRSDSSFRIEVLRNGRTEVISYSVR